MLEDYSFLRANTEDFVFSSVIMQSIPASIRKLFNAKKVESAEDVGRLLSKAYSKITVKHFQKFRKLALQCVDEYGGDRGKLRAEVEEGYAFNRDGCALYFFHLFVVSGLYKAGLKASYPDGAADEPFFAIAMWKAFEKLAERLFPAEKEREVYNNHDTLATYARPNDKIAQSLAAATEEDYAAGGMRVLEMGKKGKKKAIVSTILFDLETMNKIGIYKLDSFDLFVMWTCIALKNAGKDKTTINSIYRAMTGKGIDEEPTKKMREDIRESINRIMTFVVDIDASEICELYGYKGKNSRYRGVLLPIEILDNVTINGAEVDEVISFPYESHLMKLAKIKNNQIISYDAKLLNVPARSTRQTIVVVPYLLQRIESTKHEKMKSVILIDTVVEVTQWTDKRSRLVSLIDECFEHWKKIGYIKKYTWKKKNVGRHEQAVSLKFTV